MNMYLQTNNNLAEDIDCGSCQKRKKLIECQVFQLNIATFYITEFGLMLHIFGLTLKHLESEFGCLVFHKTPTLQMHHIILS